MEQRQGRWRGRQRGLGGWRFRGRGGGWGVEDGGWRLECGL